MTSPTIQVGSSVAARRRPKSVPSMPFPRYNMPMPASNAHTVRMIRPMAPSCSLDYATSR